MDAVKSLASLLPLILLLDPACASEEFCDPYFTDLPTGTETFPGEAFGLDGGEVEVRISRVSVVATFEDGSIAVYLPVP